MRKGKTPEMNFEKKAGPMSPVHVKDFGLYSKSNGKLLEDFKKMTSMM